MKTYQVPVSRDDYGFVTIKARSKKHAIELCEQGEWTDGMYTVRGGQSTVDYLTKEDIIELK